MRISNLLTALAATTLMAAPAMAGPASSLSVVKASTKSKSSSDLAGAGAPPILIGAIGLAFLAGVVVLTVDALDDDDQPDSN